MSSAYFAPLVNLPTVIEAPGRYVTRSGQVVEVDSVSARHDFGCSGCYLPAGVPESWHKSGRILADRETQNDVVRVLRTINNPAFCGSDFS